MDRTLLVAMGTDDGVMNRSASKMAHHIKIQRSQLPIWTLDLSVTNPA